MNTLHLGKAYLAWQAYNHKAKLGRVVFDPKRWIAVVKAIEGRPATKGFSDRKWSPTQHAKFKATMKAKANGHAKRA